MLQFLTVLSVLALFVWAVALVISFFYGWVEGPKVTPHRFAYNCDGIEYVPFGWTVAKLGRKLGLRAPSWAEISLEKRLADMEKLEEEEKNV